MKIENNTIVDLDLNDLENDTLIIPKTVTAVAVYNEGVFGFLPSVKNIIVEESNSELYIENGCLINRTTQTLILGTDNAQIPQDGSIEVIGAYAFNMRTMFEVNIPESVKEIGYMAFASLNCDEENTQPVTVHIPQSVQKIYPRAFVLNKTATFTVDEKNTHYDIEGGCLIERDTNTLIASFGKNIVVPECVTRIEKFAFLFAQHETITLHDNIEKIGQDAFVHTGIRSNGNFMPVTVYAPKNSYAYRYLARNKINRKVIS